MVAGISNVSNSKSNKKKTTNVAWSPPKKEDIMPRTQWRNKRTQTLIETGEDIGPWPGKTKKNK